MKDKREYIQANKDWLEAKVKFQSLMPTSFRPMAHTSHGLPRLLGPYELMAQTGDTTTETWSSQMIHWLNAKGFLNKK